MLDLLSTGEVISWAEISKFHRTRNGIYQRNGRLISLLTDFGRINPCYPDFHGTSADVIHYTGSGRRGDQKLDAANRALHQAIQTGHPVPLFNKLGVNRWQYLGHWCVTDAAYVHDDARERMVWKFTLKRVVDEPRLEISERMHRPLLSDTRVYTGNENTKGQRARQASGLADH